MANSHPTGAPYWKKGQSGNPGGRPKNTLQAFLRTKENLPQDIYNAVYPLLQSHKEETRIWAAEFLRDTRDGKPAQSIEHSGADGQELKINLVMYGTNNPV